MSFTRKEFANAIDDLDDQIGELNAAKSAFIKEYRMQLEGEMHKDRAKAELTATRNAITKRRKLRTDRNAVLELDELEDEILTEITGTDIANVRVHEERAPVWQEPRMVTLGDQKDAYRAGQPISQDFQYTKASVYFFAFPALGRIKIGISNDVASRLAGLSQDVGAEGELLFSMDGNRQDEMAMHRRFDSWQLQGEWFLDCVELRELLNVVRGERAPAHDPVTGEIAA